MVSFNIHIVSTVNKQANKIRGIKAKVPMETRNPCQKNMHKLNKMSKEKYIYTDKFTGSI